MARKRAPPDKDTSVEGPSAKRHLNAALAAELQTLRISANRDAAPPPPPPRHAFGASVASSPFLTSSQPTRFPTNNPTQPVPQYPFGQGSGVDLGTDFADTLVSEPFTSSTATTEPGVTQPEVIIPSSSTSSDMSMALDDITETEPTDFVQYPVRLESSNDDIIVEDMEAIPTQENRLVVYRPPVKISPEAISKINACLPDGRYLVRNPKTDEWLIKEARQDRCKRKLALVPWSGGVKKFCDSSHKPAAVIPMPWHDSRPTIGDPEQIMEIEDIS